MTTNSELGTRTLDINIDKRINLTDFKRHIQNYMDIDVSEFRVFRLCQNDLESELTREENQFQYVSSNTKLIIKLGPLLKYGEYSVPIYKLNHNMGFSYLCDFIVQNGMNVWDHKRLLIEDLKDECNLDLSIEKLRLRKKCHKQPSTIFLNSDCIGNDVFLNAANELCIEILEDAVELKTCRSQTLVYIRKWNPSDYELGQLEELLITGNSFDKLLQSISEHGNIDPSHLEVLKCRREYPYKSPILDLHKDSCWRENYILQNEKLEDGNCYYFRDNRERLTELNDDKKRELAKDDCIFFKKPSYSKKESGVKIHV